MPRPHSPCSRRLSVVLLSLTAITSPAFAQEQAAEPILLDEIQLVTSASSIATTVQDAPASITVIDQETIQATGARDVKDVLRTVPGLNLTSRSVVCRTAAR